MLGTATECSMYVSWEDPKLLDCASLDCEQETAVVEYNCLVKIMKTKIMKECLEKIAIQPTITENRIKEDLNHA